MKIGIGYDVHRLTEGRPLILGGVEIDYPLGLLGHSDADVLTHAVIDALVGAMGMGDIGRHFPDKDDRYKNIDSMVLLQAVRMMLKKYGYRVENIDSTVIAEQPRLAPHTEKMKKKIARALEIDPSAVNVKAKTEEGLGFTGKGEGIAAQAVCLIEKTEE